MLNKNPGSVIYLGSTITMDCEFVGITAAVYTQNYKPGVIVVNRAGNMLNLKDVSTRSGYEVSCVTFPHIRFL